jgi:hypothetical protein
VNWGGFRGAAAARPDTGEPHPPTHPVASNPPSGPAIQYWLKNANQEVTLTILDSAGRVIRSFTSRQDSAQAADSVAKETRRRSREDSLRTAGLSADSIQKIMRATPDMPSPSVSEDDEDAGYQPSPPPRVSNKAGVNTFRWDMRYPAPPAFKGMILWAAGVFGVTAPPGLYQVRMAVDGKPVGIESFHLIADPRVRGVTRADYAEQFRFLQRVNARFGDANDAVSTIRALRHDLDDRRGKLSGDALATFDAHATALQSALTSVEDSIYQTKSHASEDPLNYPIRLNNKIGALLFVAGSSDGRPTAQSYEVFTLLSAQLDRELARLKAALAQHLPGVNSALTAAGQPVIKVPGVPIT